MNEKRAEEKELEQEKEVYKLNTNYIAFMFVIIVCVCVCMQAQIQRSKLMNAMAQQKLQVYKLLLCPVYTACMVVVNKLHACMHVRTYYSYACTTDIIIGQYIILYIAVSSYIIL